MNELQKLMNDVAQWSNDTFGHAQRTPGIIAHLKKEVEELDKAVGKTFELTDDPEDIVDLIYKAQDEFADCFMLLIDAATHFSINADQLLQLTRDKLEINKKRKWGNPNADGSVEHIRE